MEVALNNRTCGDCQLCCRLLPVKDIAKPASTKCKHQKHGTGCAIYATRPLSCRVWSCGWLTDEATATLSRPDRSHYVIDPSPDFIEYEDNETGARTPIPVLQIWCDPKHPDAHRDPALRAMLEENRVISIIRYNNVDAFVLFPPSALTGGQWHEHTSATRVAGHSAAEIASAIQGATMTDHTEGLRRAMLADNQPLHDLAVADQRWTTEELQRDFTVQSFAAPFVVVTRKSDGAKGSMEFTHSPRFYFNFVADR